MMIGRLAPGRQRQQTVATQGGTELIAGRGNASSAPGPSRPDAADRLGKSCAMSSGSKAQTLVEKGKRLARAVAQVGRDRDEGDLLGRPGGRSSGSSSAARPSAAGSRRARASAPGRSIRPAPCRCRGRAGCAPSRPGAEAATARAPCGHLPRPARRPPQGGHSSRRRPATIDQAECWTKPGPPPRRRTRTSAASATSPSTGTRPARATRPARPRTRPRPLAFRAYQNASNSGAVPRWGWNSRCRTVCRPWALSELLGSSASRVKPPPGAPRPYSAAAAAAAPIAPGRARRRSSGTGGRGPARRSPGGRRCHS